jgi:hypothetical protein
VNTHEETLTLDLRLLLVWEDPGLEWPKGGPPVNNTFQFHPDALK